MIRAVAAICEGQVQGDELGGMVLEFIPTSLPQPGHCTWDVSQAREGGSAGAVSLILQAVLLPLSLAADNSAAVDRFLGDQLLLPAALAAESSQYVTAQITPHLRTNAWAIGQFGLAEIAIDEEKHQITVRPN